MKKSVLLLIAVACWGCGPEAKKPDPTPAGAPGVPASQVTPDTAKGHGAPGAPAPN